MENVLTYFDAHMIPVILHPYKNVNAFNAGYISSSFQVTITRVYLRSQTIFLEVLLAFLLNVKTRNAWNKYDSIENLFTTHILKLHVSLLFNDDVCARVNTLLCFACTFHEQREKKIMRIFIFMHFYEE